jgi:hypothetical protein
LICEGSHLWSSSPPGASNEPTARRVTLRDRVASVIEVGIGFHPGIDGREIIYLNPRGPWYEPRRDPQEI